MFKSGQMLDFGIQKYRLVASVACTARVLQRRSPEWWIALLYVHLCSSSGRFCLTDLSENGNQEALGIEARKNEIKKASTGNKRKKDQVLGSFRNLGRGKVRLHNAVFRRISRTVHKCGFDAGMYAACGSLPATNLVFLFGRARILCEA
jgi:hypothetical protein